MVSNEPSRLNFSYFIHPQVEGQNVSGWPQHLTIVPPIIEAIPRVGELAIQRTTDRTYEFPVTLAEQGRLGGHGVWFFDERSESRAMELHRRLIEELGGLGIKPEDFAGGILEDYKPHITYDRKLFKQQEPALLAGQVLVVDHIALVTAPPFENSRPVGPQRIENVYKLKSRE